MGINDFRTTTDPVRVAESTVNLAREIADYSDVKVVISEPVVQRDMNEKVKAVNKHL